MVCTLLRNDFCAVLDESLVRGWDPPFPVANYLSSSMHPAAQLVELRKCTPENGSALVVYVRSSRRAGSGGLSVAWPRMVDTEYQAFVP